MKILVAYTESKSVSVIRTYDCVTVELLNNIIDLSGAFSCSHVMVVEDREVVYEFVEGKTPCLAKGSKIEFKPIRVVTKRDVALVKRAWEKALANMNCANFFM